jgi:hypothetical protein
MVKSYIQCHEIIDGTLPKSSELVPAGDFKVGKQLAADVAPPVPPPGMPLQAETRLSHFPDGSLNTYNGQPPNARYNDSGQRILPGGGGGARFIPPDEYKEFLQLGHGGIFDLDLDNIDIAPWRDRGVDQGAYFNYGLDERSWRKYAKAIRKARIERHVKNKIETINMDSHAVDVDLPIEVRRAIGGWEHAAPLVHTSPNPTDEANGANVLSECGPIEHMLRPASESQHRKDSGADLSAKGFLEGLQEQIEEIQREYKRALKSGAMTPEKNLELQQRMLELKLLLANNQRDT